MKIFIISAILVIVIILVFIIIKIRDIEEYLMLTHNAIAKYSKSQLYKIGEKLAIQEFNKGEHKKWDMDEFEIEYSAIYKKVKKQIPQRYRNYEDIKFVVRSYIIEYSELINENTNYICSQDVNGYINFVRCEN